MLDLRRDMLRSASVWAALSLLAPLGMLVMSALMLLDMRQDAFEKADQTSRNLLQVIERDVARNIEAYDLSLRAIVENIRAPETANISPKLRQLLLFDRAAGARDIGVMFVLDERGEIIIDEAALPPRKGNNADREYFRVHKTRSDVGLYIGAPILSRLTGEWTLPLSRRIDKPDGSFGGVAYGSVKLSYFGHLFENLGLGHDGAINLFLRDGTRVMRYPYDEADIGKTIASSPNFAKLLNGRSGSFIAVSSRDGIERHNTFGQVGDLPLILNVSLSTREIEAEWRGKALIIGAAVLILCGLTMLLSLLFGRELRRRSAIEEELARLSDTDALTCLPNRRQFDRTFARAFASARRSGKPVSLLLVDVDHFKACNDTHGHLVGDEVLKRLARCLSASVHRPDDLVCRVGGEEFAVLLPHTDREGALRVASEIHAHVATLEVASADIAAGETTVSIGVADLSATDDGPEALYVKADAALYRAKEGGRNQTQSHSPSADLGAASRPNLRVIGV